MLPGVKLKTLSLISHSSSLINTFNSPLYTSLSFRLYVVLMGIAQPNNTIKKRDSYIPSTNHPPKYPLPSLSACSSGLFRGINTNDHPNPDPATSDSHEAQRVRFMNCIQSDTGRVREEFPEGVGSQFGPVGGKKQLQASLGRSDPALAFYTPYRSISHIWTTSVF